MSAKKINFLNILLVLALFPAGALLAKDYLVHTRSVSAVEPVRPAPARQRGEKPLTEYAPVVETGVFPAREARLTPLAEPREAEPTAEPSQVLQGLRLSGTYVGPESFAVIIKTDQGVQDTFRTGDNVFDMGRLGEIRDRSVVIRASGRDVVLSIPDVDIPAAPPVETNRVSRTPASATAPSGQTLRYSRKTGEREWTIDRGAVDNALENIGSVLGDARLTPVTENGAVQGFMVTEIKPRGIFDALGLKNGDVLRRVNGYEVTSPEKAVQVLTALKGQTDIELDIVRGGSPMSFNYQIR